MENEIIKVLDELGKRFGIAIDWSAENVLPYIKELGTRFIMYRNCMAIFNIVLSIIFFVCGIIGLKKLIKYIKSDKYNDYDDFPVAIIFGVLLGCLIIAGPIMLGCNIAGIIQNVCMPEITIVEYIQSLTTNH